MFIKNLQSKFSTNFLSNNKSYNGIMLYVKGVIVIISNISKRISICFCGYYVCYRKNVHIPLKKSKNEKWWNAIHITLSGIRKLLPSFCRKCGQSVKKWKNKNETKTFYFCFIISFDVRLFLFIYFFFC